MKAEPNFFKKSNDSNKTNVEEYISSQEIDLYVNKSVEDMEQEKEAYLKSETDLPTEIPTEMPINSPTTLLTAPPTTYLFTENKSSLKPKLKDRLSFNFDKLNPQSVFQKITFYDEKRDGDWNILQTIFTSFLIFLGIFWATMPGSELISWFLGKGLLAFILGVVGSGFISLFLSKFISRVIKNFTSLKSYKYETKHKKSRESDYLSKVKEFKVQENSLWQSTAFLDLKREEDMIKSQQISFVDVSWLGSIVFSIFGVAEGVEKAISPVNSGEQYLHLYNLLNISGSIMMIIFLSGGIFWLLKKLNEVFSGFIKRDDLL